MSHRSAAKNKADYKQRAAAKREADRIAAQRQRARAKRQVVYRWTAIVVVGLVVVGLGVAAVAHAQQASARAAATGPKNMLSDGVVLTGDGTNVTTVPTAAIKPHAKPVATVVDRSSASSPIDVVAYVDYRDPKAAAFWQADAASLKSWVSQQHVTLEVHPVALLDGTAVATPTSSPTPTADASTTPSASPSPSATPAPTSALTPGTNLTGDYSLRAAGALACVADKQPDAAYDVNAALLAEQPRLGAAGLSTSELVALVAKAGATSKSVKSCIQHGDFTDWAQQATARAKKSVPFQGVSAVSATTGPLIVVGGYAYPGDPGDANGFMTFLADVYTQQQAAAAQASGDGSSPAPTDGSSATPSAAATDPSATPSAG
jgi:hypothetical protein